MGNEATEPPFITHCLLPSQGCLPIPLITRRPGEHPDTLSVWPPSDPHHHLWFWPWCGDIREGKSKDPETVWVQILALPHTTV